MLLKGNSSYRILISKFKNTQKTMAFLTRIIIHF